MTALLTVDNLVVDYGTGRPAVDGVSLAPLLKGDTDTGKMAARTMFMQWHRGDAPVRYRNYAAITQRWKVTRPQEDGPDELYDLQRDRHETADIAAAHPDVVVRLRQEYEDWFDCLKHEKGAVINALQKRVREVFETNEYLEAMSGIDTYDEDFDAQMEKDGFKIDESHLSQFPVDVAVIEKNEGLTIGPEGTTE